MATIEAAIVAALTAETTISALVSTRVFPVGGRQGAAYPYITWQRISTLTAAHLDGPSNLDWPRFQLDYWATSAASALAVAAEVRTFLDAMPRSGGGLSFLATFQDQRGPTLDEVTKNFGVQQDYYFWHERN